MPDGGGGDGNQWSNFQNTSQTGPSPVIAPKLQELTDTFWNSVSQNAWVPSERTGVANNALWNYSTQGAIGRAPGRDASRQAMLDTIAGKYLNPDENPAFQDFLSASFRPQAEQFRDIIMPSIDSKFAGSGRVAYGGQGAHADATVRGIQELERAQSDAAAKAGLGLYQGERGNQFAALGMLPSSEAAYRTMDFADIDAMLQAGQTQDYLQGGAQADWLTRLAQSIQAIYPGGQTWGSGSSMGNAGRRGGGGLLGGALGLAGLGLQAYSAFSDERLKDVHGRVGETDEGIPLYLYHYHGDPEPRVGPIAQEVAQVKPNAVSEHPSGYLMVDYAKAMPEGGLL